VKLERPPSTYRQSNIQVIDRVESPPKMRLEILKKKYPTKQNALNVFKIEFVFIQLSDGKTCGVLKSQELVYNTKKYPPTFK